MASLIPMLFSAGAGAGAGAAGATAAGAAAPTAATLGAAAAPVAAYGTGVAAPAVAAATPALAGAAAPSLGATLAGATAPIANAAAAPAFGNNLGISYGQLNRLAQSQGNAKDFAPFANSMYQQRQPQFGQMQGLPPEQKQPDSLDNMLNFFRNIGSM